MGLINMICACSLTWMPAFFVRSHAMATAELGVWLGLITGVGGSAGTWLGGFVVSRYAARDARLQVRILALAAATSTLVLVAVLLVPFKGPSLVLMIPANLLMFFSFGPSFSLVQALSPVRMRTTMTAVVILGEVLFAGVIGLQFIGVLSDELSLKGGVDSLRWAMVVVSLLGMWAAIHFGLAARSIRQDLGEVYNLRVSRLEAKGA
jgi:hypothetical protein